MMQSGTEEDEGRALEVMKSMLLERFGPDFITLVEGMGIHNRAHFQELLDASPDEERQLVTAWVRAAAAIEAEWSAHARRLPPSAQVTLARHMEMRLPSPRTALDRQQSADAPPAAVPAAEPPTARERVSAQRRIRLELAIADAREALRRVDAVDQLVEADRQAIVAELEELMSLIGRRLQPGG
jgi:hypothetical protein